MEPEQLKKIAEVLKLRPDYMNQHLKRGNIHAVEQPVPFLRFKRKLQHIEAGTVAFMDGTVIRGFPKIRRALLLAPALRQHFSKFVLEEKMDGYNVRIAKVDGKVYAITKGGLICPYTTAFVQKPTERFFEHEDLVLCGEVVGKESPYVSHDYPYLKTPTLFIFDIRHKQTNKPVPAKEKHGLCKQYRLRPARHLGTFKAREGKRVLNVIKRLEKEGGEGVVVKDIDMRKQMKYTTSKGNTDDLAFAFQFPFDYGRDFFYRRIIREGFQSFELKEGEAQLKKRAQRLGMSLLQPMVNSIKKVAKGKEVTEDLTISGEKPDLEAFMDHLDKMHVDYTAKYLDKEETRLRISRRPKSTNERIKAYLQGAFCEE